MSVQSIAEFQRCCLEAQTDVQWLANRALTSIMAQSMLFADTAKREIMIHQMRVITVLSTMPDLIEYYDSESRRQGQQLDVMRLDILNAMKGLRQFLINLQTMPMATETRSAVEENLTVIDEAIAESESRLSRSGRPTV